MKLAKFFTTLISLLAFLTLGTQAYAQEMTKTNWFGGETYNGEPALKVTAALIQAGGGPEDFNFHTALVSMLGEKTVEAEVAKLAKQYGDNEVNSFVSGMNFAVNSAIKHVTAAGIKLPDAPEGLEGVELAKTLVEAGTAPDGTWWSGLLFDKALSHQIHNKVMTDIETVHGFQTDKLAHKILNQAMYDVAQALGYENVKLAKLH